jgi:hypothetical protein
MAAPLVLRRIVAHFLAVALALTEVPLSAHAQEPAYPLDPDARGPVSPVSPVAIDGVPAELAPPPVSAVPHAQRLAASGRFAEAALAWEAMWKETGDARFLYHAAVARARAGRHALALRRFEQVLAALGGTSEAVRRHLEEKIAGERALTVAFRLRCVESTPAGLAPVGAHLVADGPITVEPDWPGGQAVQDDRIELGGYRGDEVRVDPGAWRVRAELPMFAPVTSRHQAIASTGEVTWEVVVERKMVAVELRFSPPRALRGARVMLTATDHAPGFGVERELTGPTETVMLTAGTWQLRAVSRRYQAEWTLAIVPGKQPVDVVMQRGRPDLPGEDRLSVDRRAMFGMIGLVSVGWYAGLGLMAGGASRQNKADERNRTLLTEAGADPKTPPFADAVLAEVDAAYPTARYHRDLRIGADLSFSGASVALFGLGTTLGMLPAILRKPRRQLLIPFGVGLAVTAAGAAWTAHYLRARDGLLEPAVADHRVQERQFDRLVGHQLGGSMLLGIGLGLASFAPVYWLAQAIKRRKRARATADAALLTAPGTVGVTLHGSF